MTLRPCLSLLAATLLAACQVGPVADPRPSRAPAKPATASASPGPAAAAKASAGPLKSAAPAPAQLLAAPAGGSLKLAGTLKVDPTYLVAAGGGNLVAAGGGNLVAAGGGNVLSHNGSTAIAANGRIVAEASGNAIATTGADLAAAGGLNMVAASGGNIIAAGGGNLIGNDGSTLVAAGGGNLVAAGGGNLVAAGGGNYRLAQADATSSGQVPAAGMLVSVVSLTKRQYLPLGVDAAGKEVYAVYSNTAGGFEVHLPKGTDANVMVVASVPGSKDAGLIYNAVATNGEGAPAVLLDEDAATVTRYLRLCFLQRLADILVAPDTTFARALVEKDGTVNDNKLAVALIQGMVDYLYARGAERGIPAIADPAERRAKALAFAEVVTDAAFSAYDFAGVKIDPAIVPRWKNPRERLPGFGVDDGYAVPVLRAAFRELRERAEKRMRGPDGRYQPFDDAFFLRNAVGIHPADWGPRPGNWDDFFGMIEGYDLPGGQIVTYPIAKPGQVADYLVARYLGVGRPFVYEPVLATYMQLDTGVYAQEPTVFKVGVGGPLRDDEIVSFRARLATHAARYPSLAETEASPIFSVARREAAGPWARCYELVGFTLFAQLAYNLPDPASPIGKAVVEALRTYDARPAGG